MRVITISREFGAGGRTIAKGLSEKLGIPWYDRDFIKLTAQNSGYSEDEIQKEGEEIGELEHMLEAVLNNVAAYTSSHDAIFKAQKEAMLELAKEPCIIVGRCSNIILREAGVETFDIFLFADEKIRLERAKDIVKDPKTDIKKYVEKRDALRANYYKAYTKKEMGKANDFNICIDTGVVDYDTCLDMLCKILEK